MRPIESFIEVLSQRGKPEATKKLARELLQHYYDLGFDLELRLKDVTTYCAVHISGKADAFERIVILFWYADQIKSKDAGTYLITLLGTIGVIESQRSRLEKLHGEEVAERIFEGLQMPSLGSDLGDYSGAIGSYLKRMSEVLDPIACKKVLAGNHHEVNPEAFAEEKRLWQQSDDMDSFLVQKHQRLVDRLQEHADTGKLWFEQYITQDVVDYVAQHQEIQTGIRQDDKIIVSKIPYNPVAWLKETDPRQRRFYACHCPFTRFSILSESSVDELWCYCSGGFTKLFFDYLYEQDLEVELLESVLSGADRCLFAIKLPEKV